MTRYLFIGAGFAFAAAVQPGPLQAFLLSSVAQKGWKRTLPASLSPLISDGPIAVLMLTILQRVPPTAGGALQAAGGAFLIFLAGASFRQWRRSAESGSGAAGETRRTLFQAVVVNLLNPSPYLGWALVLGPATMDAWRSHAAYAGVFILAFYATMITVLAFSIFLFGATRFLGPASRRALILVSAMILAVIGLYQLVLGLRSCLENLIYS